ncbi:hypothetical protein Mterra_01311 [Calidithermus terrae]|uniref:DUF4864 domain-containing protein n=1 Tax=Calidithermus terrae TaxID=1408545 RepID=A0A399EU14_9DEIN|nr:DUF4864 domain-containing protein [Calidithermus terrae]RIH86996.1 hypothetical protein Mterra_01311 [Calidithermus terrae]
MKAPVLLALLVALAFGLAQGPGVTARDAQAIRAVIEGQIAAFKAGDAERAFAYASPGIRERFGDAQNFVRMVRESYAPLYRPLEVEFLRLTRVERTVVQVLGVTALDGQKYVAYYFMQKQPSGEWRISGVVLEPAAPTDTA